MILDNAENFSQEKNQFLHELLKMFTEELSLIIVLKDTFKNCLDCEKCNKIAYKANNICCHDFCTNFVNNKITINSKKIQIINDVEHGSNRPTIFFQIALNLDKKTNNKQLKTYAVTFFVKQYKDEFYVESWLNYYHNSKGYKKYFCFNSKKELQNFFKDKINDSINYFSNLSYDD